MLLVKVILNSYLTGPKKIPFYNLSIEPAFTCSKSPMETPDECLKSVGES